MRLSHLFAMSILLGSGLVACGDDGGGGGGGGGVDAPVVIDAPMIDAPPAVSMGLGAICNANQPCPSSAMICASLNNSMNGFCTLSCGSGPVPAMGQDPMPPANGNMICMNNQPASPAGTPACVLTGAAMNNMLPWACGLLCGTFEGTNLGDCPGGNTCKDNLCEPI